MGLTYNFVEAYSKGLGAMAKLKVYLALCTAVVALTPSSAACYPRNYLSAALGARITTQTKLAGNADPNALLSDGPISKGWLRFADVNQLQIFTADLGRRREFDTVQIGTGGTPRKIRIAVSKRGPNGPFKTIFEMQTPVFFQTLRFPRTVARCVRFDLGQAASGCAVLSLRLYKGFEHRHLAEVTKLLRNLVRYYH